LVDVLDLILGAVFDFLGVAVELHRRVQCEVACRITAGVALQLHALPCASFLYGLQILQFVAAIDDEKLAAGRFLEYFSTLRLKL
jgi:hypothetical protein